MSRNEARMLLQIKEWLEKQIETLTFSLEVYKHALERVKTLIAVEEAFGKEA